MTCREAYEYALIECNKLNAPAILLEDYVYLFNKAIQQYVNGVYNRCEYNQQSSDDLGWLHTTTILSESNKKDNTLDNETIYCFDLSDLNYLHMLGCKVQLSGSVNNSSCESSNSHSVILQCSRLTADLDSGITNNYYMKPSHRKPYYYIVDIKEELDNTEANAEKNKKTLEIHIGKSNWVVDKVQISYLKTPNLVSLNYDEVNSIDDTSDELEFPNYVCYEIINIFTRLLLENASDPRLKTHIPINQSIAVPE